MGLGQGPRWSASGSLDRVPLKDFDKGLLQRSEYRGLNDYTRPLGRYLESNSTSFNYTAAEALRDNTCNYFGSGFYAALTQADDLSLTHSIYIYVQKNYTRA